MKEYLLIRIASQPDHPLQFLIWHEQEGVLASGDCPWSELASLTGKAQQREVIVLTPAADVQLKTVPLPNKWSRKLEAALPYMLEEDIASDIDEVFIAIGQSQEFDGQHSVQVAVVENDLFSQWLSQFNDAGLIARKWLPDALCLPQHDGLTAIELNHSWLLRSGPWQIAEVESNWLNAYLQFATPSAVHHYSPWPNAVNHDNLVHQAEELPLALLAPRAVSEPFTLRQGPYQLKKARSKQWQYWFGPAVAAGILVVMSLLGKVAEQQQLNRQITANQAQLIALYQQHFPGEKVRPELIRNQLNAKLAKSGSGSSQASLLNLLAQLEPVFKGKTPMTTESLRFDGKRGELKLRVRGKDFAHFETVKSALERAGLTVESGSLNNDGATVVGELKIRSGN